jgi:hypothetical protein
MTDEEHKGVVESLTSLGRAAITVIPPAFLLLVALNVVFIAGLFWFLERQNAGRERVISAIVEGCLQQKGN